jgi:uncharacterized protein (TIGR00369 family)
VSLAVSPEDIGRILVESEFLQGFGFRLEALEDGVCALRFPFQQRFERPGGVVTGIVFMAAADLAMWFALMTRLGEAADRSVTIDLATSFVRGARAEDVVTTARVLSFGEAVIYGVADSCGRDGRLIAHHTLNYVNPGKQG